MIHASDTWIEVEAKLIELRQAVDDMWDHGNWEAGLKGSLARALKVDLTADDRERLETFMSTLGEVEPEQ